MKIKRVHINGLFEREEIIDLSFKSDLNIFTGANGSGKTAIMKLIWFIISGRIVRALIEVPFKTVMIETDIYTVTVFRTGSNTCRVKWERDGKEFDFVDDDAEEFGGNAEDEPNRMMGQLGRTLFFPTFRRIEGGFASRQQRHRPSWNAFGASEPQADIEVALRSLSEQLSDNDHHFVSALSTSDIERLLLKQYTDASEVASKIQQETSDQIIDLIVSFKKEKYQSGSSEEHNSSAAEAVLDTIRSMIDDMERQRASALSQYNAIRNLVLRIFRHSGIKVGRLSMGDAAAAISSDSLSAGEKQMLSFLCYNAFYGEAIVFIDEPELSLHVDWQRQLFPTLFSQQKDNQFIIATHSPFIYSKYPDKEIQLEASRGDSEAHSELF